MNISNFNPKSYQKRSKSRWWCRLW